MSVNFLILYISNKCNHIWYFMSGFYQSVHNIFEIHPCCIISNFQSSKLNNISLYEYITSLFTHWLMNIWVVFTFWLLWIILMYHSCIVFCMVYTFSQVYTSQWNCWVMLTPYLTCWGTAKLFFLPQPHNFIFPPARY